MRRALLLEGRRELGRWARGDGELVLILGRELAREGLVVGDGRAGVEEEGRDVGLVVVAGRRYAAELLEELVGAPLAVVEGVAVEALAARAESQLISRI